MIESRKDLKHAGKIVVKIGTGALSDEQGRLDSGSLAHLVSQICHIKDNGASVIIVSSGAIGAGMGILGLKLRPSSVSHKQAAAAIGQIQLMRLYDKFFSRKKRHVAQVLLTRDDFSDKKRYDNAKNTISIILDYKAVPIINENDTVATEEIKFGDNDNLSGLVCNMIQAQLLIILSDVNGLLDESNKVVSVVENITQDIEKLARGTTKQISTGGMITKLEAAKKATSGTAACVIANGRQKNVLAKILNGDNIGTLFLPR